jgi:predicted nucleic acid-binding protein
MKIEGFLDTNVLIYAAAGRKTDPRKHSVARKLIADVAFGVSAQTLGEFYVAVGRKAALKMPLDEIDEWIELLTEQPFTPVDQDIVRSGIFLSRRYNIQYYDASLLAAAERLGAATFYTEDLKHNEVYGTVRAVNPFLEH